MALEQLLDIVQSSAFDLVVVDTPPASHALELFDAPERILALLDSRALEYLGEPMRILGGASSRLARGLLSAVLTGLERMTGLSLLSDISALATDFGAVVPGFRERARAIRALLRADDTRYVLLAAADPHATRDLVAFAREVERAGVTLDAVVVNRVLSFTLDDQSVATAHGSAAPSATTSREATTTTRRRWSATLARHLVACAKDLDTLRAAQRAVIEGLRDGLLPASGTDREAPVWVELPALSPAPTTLDGIVALARALAGTRARSTTAA
jgi:anion-transporting  ArsA/GET3 family ATPase